MAGLMHLVSVTASLISLLVLRPQRNRDILLRALREGADRLPDDSRAVCQESTADPASRNGSSREDTRLIDPPPGFPRQS
jgi:hypothetical protein